MGKVPQTANDHTQDITGYLQAWEKERLALLDAATPTQGEKLLLGSSVLLFLLLIAIACWP
jgi:hypothetical protein